ncbi:guanine deaminase [Rhodopirellula maiorica SM1]|uniref:Guanine deaminase n=1 Tax=Rhodopirellula maiorica SM1 TaxID=1265738 RepID=M5RM25_9BACT|nr:amidohydrolase family protein [Rhodopirellula maiorica]EMI16437.1 guanine deaminase [Rhodopirellula maiorica SM1]
MTLLTGRLLVADPNNQQMTLRSGSVRIRGEQITDVVLDDDLGDDHDADIRANRFRPLLPGEQIISPGFTDAHLHLSQFGIIGAHGLPLLRWLDQVTFPAERAWQDVHFARETTRSVLTQLLSFGTTSFCGYTTVHHESAMAALTVAKQMGFRGMIGQVLMDRNAPPELCRETHQLIDEAAKSLECFPSTAEMAAAITPRFAITCSPQLLESAGTLADQHHAAIQTHLAETQQECARVAELFDSARYVDVYRQAKLLTPRTILGHGVHLNPRDRETLATHRAVIAHCPTANDFLGSGRMDRQALDEAKVNVVLGSDIGAGFSRSMVSVARAGIETAASLGNTPPTAASAWYDITAGAANVLGWDNVGQLRKGNRADMVVIQPDFTTQMQGCDSIIDPLSQLMFAWDDRWIKQTYLRGQSVWGG